ncbi:MAG: hypothetical protein AAGA28_05000 [Pseudomonadota bacterium]
MSKTELARRIATAGGTLLCVLGIGFFMQSTAHTTAPQTQVASDTQQKADVGPNAASDRPASAPLEQIKMTSAATGTLVPLLTGRSASDLPKYTPQPAFMTDAPIVFEGRHGALIYLAQVDLPQEEAAPAFDCTPRLTATKALAAMATIELQAHCLPNTPFTLSHSGLIFTAVTDSDGRWENTVPALREDAFFVASFENGKRAEDTVKIDALSIYDRYVVQWQGQSGLQLHVLESGAKYGEAGHVWAGAARDMAAAIHGTGGFLVALGDRTDLSPEDVFSAQVYTVQARSSRKSNVSVRVEAEVQTTNCGNDIAAQVLIRSDSRDLISVDLAVAMPDCSARGEFVMLKNLDGDLTLALR